MILDVRYMKQVTPYFQKAMLLSDVGWENPPFLSSGASGESGQHHSESFHSPNSEMKWTPLHLACITKDANLLEENCTFEIHSPNRKHSILVRVNANQLDKWFSGAVCPLNTSP